jgi:predicted peptidase
MKARKTGNGRTPRMFESVIRKRKHDHSFLFLVLAALALNSNPARSAEPAPTAPGKDAAPASTTTGTPGQYPYDLISVEQRRKLEKIRDSIGSIKNLDALYQNRTNPNGLPYHLYVPAALQPGTKYPLVIFLHGATDLTIDTHKGFPKGIWSLPQVQSKHPHILFVPRFRTNRDAWVHDDYRKMVMQALDDLVQEFNQKPNGIGIDVDRVYLAGFSMGGMGAWDYVKHEPNRFAAVCPLSGFSVGPQNEAEAKLIQHVPIWIFNGDGDKGVGGSRLSYQMLKRAGAPDVHYHEYVQCGHVIDDIAFFTEGFMDWLFAQKRKSAR